MWSRLRPSPRVSRRCVRYMTSLNAHTRDSWSALPILKISKDLQPVCTIDADRTVSRAVVDMVKARTGSLMVTSGVVRDGTFDQDHLAGILTERDILTKLPLEEAISRRMPVRALMTPRDRVVSKPASATLEQCVNAMRQGGFRHLPLLRGKNEVKAVISARDLAANVVDALWKAPTGNLPSVAELMESMADSSGSRDCVEVISGRTPVSDIVLLMRETRAGSVLVRGSAGGLRGIVTERDYLSKFVVYAEQDAAQVPVSEIMTPVERVHCISPERSIATALSAMLGGGFRHAPVTHREELLGVISMRDILNRCWELHSQPIVDSKPREYESDISRVDTGLEIEQTRGSRSDAKGDS